MERKNQGSVILCTGPNPHTYLKNYLELSQDIWHRFSTSAEVQFFQKNFCARAPIWRTVPNFCLSELQFEGNLTFFQICKSQYKSKGTMKNRYIGFFRVTVSYSSCTKILGMRAQVCAHTSENLVWTDPPLKKYSFTPTFKIS